MESAEYKNNVMNLKEKYVAYIQNTETLKNRLLITL